MSLLGGNRAGLTNIDFGHHENKASAKRVVSCDEVETAFFPLDNLELLGCGPSASENQDDPSNSDSDDDESGGVVLPGVDHSTRSVHVPSDLGPRTRGMQRARHREMVRQAARRGVAFGFTIIGSHSELEYGNAAEIMKKVIAVQNGRPVESSFAKGDWGVKWQDEHS